jgi:hypothetical protein
MKKIILISFFTIFCLSISAQRLGFIGGYQLTSSYAIAGKIADNSINFNPTSGSGFLVGGYFDWNIKNLYGLDAQLLYSMRSTKFDLHYISDTTTILKRKTFQLEVPLHFYLNFPLKKGWILSPYIGPALSIGLHGKDIAWENTDFKKPVDLQTSEMYGAKEKGRVNRFELAGQIGLTAKYRNYGIRAGYSVGLTNLTKQTFDWTLSPTKLPQTRLYNGDFSASFIYVFDLRK